jgi:Fe-S cluster assembly iron-binding protein IscA
MLNLTDSAIRRFKEFLTQENLSNQGMGIRIFASSGG